MEALTPDMCFQGKFNMSPSDIIEKTANKLFGEMYERIGLPISKIMDIMKSGAVEALKQVLNIDNVEYIRHDLMIDFSKADKIKRKRVLRYQFRVKFFYISDRDIILFFDIPLTLDPNRLSKN